MAIDAVKGFTHDQRNTEEGRIMAVLIAVALALFAGLAAKAGMKGFAKILGIVALLVFMGWLLGGPGFAILDWFDNPQVEIPNEIPIPGQ